MKKNLILTAVMVMAGLGNAVAFDTKIVGTNAVGFVKVNVPIGGTNTIIGTAFERCMGNGAAIMLSDLVSTTGLKHAATPADADQLLVLTTNASGEDVYYYYWYKTDKASGWETNATYKIGTNVVEIGMTVPDATNFPVARGLAFWLKRKAPTAAVDVYVKGQVPTNSQPITLQAGTNYTLITLGAFTPTNLNEVSSSNWGVRYDGDPTDFADKLWVNNNGTWVSYTYNASSNKWLDAKGALPTVTIQPGTGFWYLRRGTTNLTFTPVAPQQ